MLTLKLRLETRRYKDVRELVAYWAQEAESGVATEPVVRALGQLIEGDFDSAIQTCDEGMATELGGPLFGPCGDRRRCPLPARSETGGRPPEHSRAEQRAGTRTADKWNEEEPQQRSMDGVVGRQHGWGDIG